MGIYLAPDVAEREVLDRRVRLDEALADHVNLQHIDRGSEEASERVPVALSTVTAITVVKGAL